MHVSSPTAGIPPVGRRSQLETDRDSPFRFSYRCNEKGRSRRFTEMENFEVYKGFEK